MDTKLQSESERILSKVPTEHQIKIIDKQAVNHLLSEKEDVDRYQGSSYATRDFKLLNSNATKWKRPKRNIVNLNINPRVNTASGNFPKRKKLRPHKSEKILSRRSSKKSVTERLDEIDFMKTLKTPYEKLNYQIAYNPTWAKDSEGRPGIMSEFELAKRPKSRQLSSSASVRNLLHQKRLNLKSHNMKRGVNLPQPPFGKTIGHGILPKSEL